MKKRLLFFLFLLFFGLSFAGMSHAGTAESDVAFTRDIIPVLTLREAYQYALKRSEELAIHQINIDQTWADYLDATGTAIGDMSFQFLHSRQENQGGASSEEGGATGTLTRSTRRTRQFVISQPLFQGFKTLGAIRGAGKLREQKKQELKRAEQILFLDVASAFYTVLWHARDVAITEEMLRLFRERVQELDEWEKIGKSRPSEIATAQARRKRIEADLAKRKGEYAVYLRTLEFLTGLSLGGTEIQDDGTDAEVKKSLVELAGNISYRPDLAAAENFKELSQNNIIVAQSGLWPEISLDTHLYEKREGFQSGIDWDLLFTIDVPIYKGGESLADVKNAVSEYKKSKLEYDWLYRQAETEVKQAYDSWKASYEESLAMREAVEASEENYKLQREEYTKRLVDNLDVLAALETLNDNRIEANRAHYENKINYWKLQIAAGNCCESL